MDSDSARDLTEQARFAISEDRRVAALMREPKNRAALEQRVAVTEALLLRLADYENRITWDTTCGNCARLLDASIADYERAERAEAQVRAAEARSLAAIGAIPRRTGNPEWSKGSAVAQAAGFDMGLAYASDAVATALAASRPTPEAKP